MSLKKFNLPEFGLKKMGIKKAYIYPGILLLIVLFLFFHKFGLLKYISLKNQKKELQEKIGQVEEKNKALRLEIDSLKTDEAKIEKVAREKFKMVRQGEKVFTVDEK